MSSTTTPKFEVVVHMPESVPEKLIKAESIKTSVTDNEYYGVPSPTVIVFGNDIDAATEAEAATKTTPPTVTANFRDGKVNKVMADVESYRLDCQKLVNLAPDEIMAKAIAQSFDMELKTHTAAGPRQDEILDGPLPGSALYRMLGKGPHQIQISWDKGDTSKDIDPSSGGEKVITSLPLNTDFWLRNRQILTKGRYSDWTGWKKFSIRK